MPTLRLVLGDQLSQGLSSLRDIDPEKDLVLMAEVQSEATYVRHHKRKIAFLFSAMRHFADALRIDDVDVEYITLDDPKNQGSLKAQLATTLQAHSGRFDRVVITKPGEWRLMDDMETWSGTLGIAVELRDDDRFIASLKDFADWAGGRKQLRMEYFYRDMRRKTGLLMDGDAPAGGLWNYDQENRKRLPKSIGTPDRIVFELDDITRDVLELVEHRFGNHFGSLADFNYAVTQADAELAMDHFIEDILPAFGDYQDAMAKGEAFLWHSLISAYLNCGLLDALEVCRRAETAWKDGFAPLNAVEGFIRQIIGWREYVRGLYWYSMPAYREMNFFNAVRTLPSLYWTGETDMACMREAIDHTLRYAYSHHIQRLMITGNFALLAGLHPDDVNGWYLAVYHDAYEWVEMPNTHGMAIFADGGVMASKPYAASANYINKMSNYCSGCAFDHKARTGEKACPFNYLYWDFLARNETKLRGNPRMGLTLKNLDKKDAVELKAMRDQASRFLESIGAFPRD
ncbi:MAG: cryptochrome/photolyase family protein [Pseudomonadota bacterium]